MSYNSNLQSKITRIQSIIDTVNELPEIGNGGEQATPEISINTSGLITATAGTKTATKQLAFQPAKTITPSSTSQVAVSSGYYTGGNITVAGDSNLVASNIKSGVSIFGVNGTLEEGSGSGEAAEWSENEDAMIEGTITNYTNDRVKSICDHAFNYCSSLTAVSFPACTTIGNHAFYDCSSLTAVSFPTCTTISDYAFYNCSSLTTISFPACKSIGRSAFGGCKSLTTASFPVCIHISDSAFAYCKSLTTVSFPICTSIGGSAFYSCKSLTTVSFPACKSIGGKAFYDCSSLTTASFPMCASISDSVFAYCRSLTTVSFPICTTIGNSAFYGCSSLTTAFFPICTSISDNAFAFCISLTTASFPICTSIGGSAFRNCITLFSLILGASTVCTLYNSSIFYSTPYAGYSASFSGTPYIYVPASLVDAYKTATNWTYFSSYITAIPTIITFTTNGVEYQAEEGMTWGEWVESNYNTGGYIIIDETVATSSMFPVLYENSEVHISDLIIVNGVYTIDRSLVEGQ